MLINKVREKNMNQSPMKQYGSKASSDVVHTRIPRMGLYLNLISIRNCCTYFN